MRVLGTLQEPFYPTAWPKEVFTFWFKEARPHSVAGIILILFLITYIPGLMPAHKHTHWRVISPIIITASCVMVMLVFYYSEIIHYSPMFKSGVAYVSPYKVALIPIIYSSPLWVVSLLFVFFSNRKPRSASAQN